MQDSTVTVMVTAKPAIPPHSGGGALDLVTLGALLALGARGATHRPRAALGADTRLFGDHLLEALEVRDERRLVDHAHLADDRHAVGEYP